MRFAYYRVSAGDQSIDAQRHELGFALGPDAAEFHDEGVSGAVPMLKRPGFAAMAVKMREGDELHVAAVDRLGRDAIDVQATVRQLLDQGVTVHVRGLGQISRGAGELVLAVLAQVADMERRRIWERAEAGRAVARASLEATGKTHRGKTSMGRTQKADPEIVVAWRAANAASISTTAEHFGLSDPTVKRYCAQIRKAAA
jgi:putative DNA-invertase from lambdoid prophage Rac